MPGWLQDTFLMDYAPEFTAALVGLGILLLIVAAVRRSRGRRTRYPAAAPQARIGVLEWTVVDEKRRLVLIQRDDVEHLVMIGGPTDVVIEANIGAEPMPALASVTPAAPKITIDAPVASPVAPAAPKAAAAQPIQQGAEDRAAPRVLASVDGEGSASSVAPDSTPARPAAKPRPPLAAVPAVAPPAAPAKTAAGPAEPPGAGRRATAASADGKRSPIIEADVKQVAARRPATGRVEPGIAAAGATSRWAGGGQTAQIMLNEPANTQDRGARDGAARPQAGPADQPQPNSPTAGGWAENDDIESEIGRALQIDPFPPLAFPAGGSDKAAAQDPMLKTSGAATAPGTTLGDLAERLEEALAREVRSASQGRTRLDLDLDAFTAGDRGNSAGTGQPAPAAAPAAAAEPRRETQAAIDQHDDPPVISLSARRREMGDPLEDEMARLLGELTDGARR